MTFGIEGLVRAFVVGGAICALAQLVMDITKLNAAHIMVMFVSLGAVVSSFGLYGRLVSLAGAGAAIPLPGFGHLLTQGILEEMQTKGMAALLTGGLKAGATGLGAAIIFGYLFSVLFNPKG